MEEENIVSEVTPPEPKPQKLGSFIWEMARFIILAIIIVIPIRVYIAQPFVVSGASMDPTFANGQYLVIDEISYRFHEPTRDDVIVFRYPNDTKKFFIKRIIGLPNETVEIKNGTVIIYNADNEQGFKLDEPYIVNHSGGNTHFELGPDEYFVMGDNRPASSDSRYWGSVHRDLIVGQALLRLLPVKELGIYPGGFKQND